ncbi:MAG: hypothetical protein GY769_07810 [bacterium]|nr:hypothetical protein [bacterium]
MSEAEVTMLMYVITDEKGEDRFICEDVQVCLANMQRGERTFAVTYRETDRELVLRRGIGDELVSTEEESN